MPTVLSADLSYVDLRAGWQTVADRYKLATHVFRLKDGRYFAVSNRAHGDGIGEFVETIVPRTGSVAAEPDTDAHGLGAIPGRCSHDV